jgi:carbamoyltransferase
MLFNYRVKTRSIPAVTHFDSTARAQVVCDKDEILYRLLLQFKALTGIGVLINTSFNGPGRPIVETESDAFTEARTLGIDYILTDEGLFVNLN